MYRALAMVAAAMPFAFALIRAGVTGNDWRYLWLAAASLAGAAATTSVQPSSRKASSGVLILLAAVVIATASAGAAALLLGTRWNLGMLVVASSFGLCSAVGSFLYRLARATRYE
jgi:CHASE2 domain-containing sensor protein